MKNSGSINKVISFVIVLSFTSCNIFKQSSKIVYKQDNHLGNNWEILTKNWNADNGLIEGNGGSMDWAVLLLKDSLPNNYEIDLDVNMVNASLFELMLNIDKDKYIRVYLYEIEHALKLGRGEFARVAEGRPGGGPTIETAPVELRNNTWYNLKITYDNKLLVVKLNGKKALYFSLQDENLSTKGLLGLLTNEKVLLKDMVIKAVK